MAIPVITVEVGFAATPLDVLLGNAITWTAITSWVRLPDGISFSRGRPGPEDAVTAGRLSLTLNNRDGRFTAGLASGPYHPLKIRVPIRVRWTPQGGSATTLWTGTVDDWGTGWHGAGSRVAVTATDMVARVQRKPLLALPVQAQIGAGVTWIYPLDETQNSDESFPDLTDRTGSATAPVLVRTAAGAVAPTWTTGTLGTGFSPGSGETEAESTVAGFAPEDAPVTGQKAAWIWVSRAAAAPATISAVDFMVLPTSFPAVMATMVVTDNASNEPPVISVSLWTTGEILAQVTNATSSVTLTGTSVLSTLTWSHVCVKIVGSTVTLWVNGIQEDTDTLAGAIGSSPTPRLHVGGRAGFPAFFAGNLCNVGVWTTVPSDAQILDVAGGRDGWAGDGAVTRAFRIARAAGMSAATTTGGDSELSPQATKGMGVADALQICADTELAPWWVTPAGVITMAPRHSRHNLSDTWTVPASLVSPSTILLTDDSKLINKVTGSRPGGATVTRTDAASVAAYETYDETRALHVRTDEILTSLVTSLASNRATPVPRSDSVEIEMLFEVVGTGDGLDETTILTAELGTQFGVTGLPATAPTSSMSWLIEGTTDMINNVSWRRVINASPESPTYAVVGDLVGDATVVGV